MTDMSCDPERLAADRSAVNKQLDMLDIPQFDKAFGAWRDNQIQVIGIQRVDTELNPRLVFVTYRVIIPSGDVRSYTVQYNAHSASSSGVVLIVKVNGKYAVVRQRRFVIEQYLTELMRSFPAIPQDPFEIQPTSGLLKVNGLPLRCALEELGPDVLGAARLKSEPRCLGKFPENTGWSAVRPEIWFFNLRVPKEALATRLAQPTPKGGVLQLRTLRELVEAWQDDQLQDAHSVTAFMRYLKEFNLLRVLADPSRADEIELRG
jgi:hypothetical protein